MGPTTETVLGQEWHRGVAAESVSANHVLKRRREKSHWIANNVSANDVFSVSVYVHLCVNK